MLGRCQHGVDDHSLPKPQNGSILHTAGSLRKSWVRRRHCTHQLRKCLFECRLLVL